MAPILHAAGAHTRIPDLGADPRHGLHDQVAAVVATLDAVPRTEALVLVGHSYAGLVVREAADLRLDHVDHIVLVDGWAGGDRASMFTLAPPHSSKRFVPLLWDNRFRPRLPLRSASPMLPSQPVSGRSCDRNLCELSPSRLT